MVNPLTTKPSRLSWNKHRLMVFVGAGLLSILSCSYGYAAQSTDLLIEGRADMRANAEIRNTAVRVVSKTDDASEAYNAEYSVKSASLYPQIANRGGEIVYAVTTCNMSKNKTFELTGLDEPATNLGTMVSDVAKVNVGSRLALGTLVGPGECVETEVSFTQTVAGGVAGALTLDYTWTEYNGVGFDITYMQEMTPEVCAKVSNRETKQLIDQRDGKKYWVTKMYDGNCWMTQNLDYDGGGATRFTEATVKNWVNDSNSSPSQYMYVGDNADGHESYGSFYSASATANVCPTGWRMPTGGTGGELLNLISIDEIQKSDDPAKVVEGAPFYFVKAGWTEGRNGWREKGTAGNYWSSTRKTDQAYTTHTIAYGSGYNGDLMHGWQDYDYYGESVRCIAKTGNEVAVKDLKSINTMQEMTLEVCDNSYEGDTKQLEDERDGKKYWVTKLKDGKCWMTQNLDYDGGGTRFDSSSDLSNWVAEQEETWANVAQYYYNGDNDLGHDSMGSYYSYKASLNVCPTGWRLPIGGANGDYQNLFGGNSLGTTVAARLKAIQESPYYFKYAGWVGNTGFLSVGTRGNYNSARQVGDSTVYTVDIGQSTFDMLAADAFYWGESVRCVYGEPATEPTDIFTIATMQELTPQICANTTVMDESARRLLTDTRDGHKYWVTKLAKDGNCWMVQNMDYDVKVGTRYDDSSDFSKWTMTGYPEQYYYRGDWQDGLKSYGSLYSWQTAQSVCPANWRLPTGGPNSEEVALWSGIANSTTGINKLRSSPFYFVWSGYVENTGFNGQGKEGYWWSSTKGPTGGYVISYSTSASKKIRPYTDEGAYWGESVRCMMSGN